MSITEDVAVLLGRDLTTAENDRVDRLADLAEGLIEGTLPGFTITSGTETATIEPGSDVLWTPRYPVTTINSFTVSGQDITDQVTANKYGRIRFNSVTAFNAFELNISVLTDTTVTVDYDYGFDTIPDDVAGVVAAMVAATLARQAANPNNVQSEALGAYQVSYGDWAVKQAAAGLVVPEGALRQWRRNRQVDVALTR